MGLDVLLTAHGFSAINGVFSSEEALPRLKDMKWKKCRDCARQRQEWDVAAFTQKFPWN